MSKVCKHSVFFSDVSYKDEEKYSVSENRELNPTLSASTESKHAEHGTSWNRLYEPTHNWVVASGMPSD